jgi:hypothetical protein
MIFSENTRKLPQAVSDRISAKVNYRPAAPKQKGPIFDENTRKLTHAASDRISPTANDRPIRPKLKWSTFGDF